MVVTEHVEPTRVPVAQTYDAVAGIDVVVKHDDPDNVEPVGQEYVTVEES